MVLGSLVNRKMLNSKLRLKKECGKEIGKPLEIEPRWGYISIYVPGSLESSKVNISCLISLRLKSISVALLRRENCYRLIPEGVLTAHTNGYWVWDCCIAVPPNTTGMWKRWELWVIVAQWLEHWQLKPAIWVRFPVTSQSLFHIPFSTWI